MIQFSQGFWRKVKLNLTKNQCMLCAFLTTSVSKIPVAVNSSCDNFDDWPRRGRKMSFCKLMDLFRRKLLCFGENWLCISELMNTRCFLARSFYRDPQNDAFQTKSFVNMFLVLINFYPSNLQYTVIEKVFQEKWSKLSNWKSFSYWRCSLSESRKLSDGRFFGCFQKFMKFWLLDSYTNGKFL